MTASYRVVQFLLDPFSGARVPVGALVQAGRDLRIVRAPHLPGAETLGSGPRAALVRMLADALGEATAFDRLPAAMGPQAVLGEIRQAPFEAGEEAARWVERHVLPQLPA